MTSPEYLEPEPGRRLAYHRLAASDDAETAPGVVFLGGFKSDMTGTKAVFLESWCQERGRAFLRFDYTGHGQSSGDFLDGCIGDWARDAHDAVTALTEGPQIIVGSSMGGWIALLLARRAPERVAALVGIAAAPDFTEDGMWAEFTEAQRAAIMAEGRLDLPSEYSDEPYVITRRLIEDGREQLVLRTPLLLPFPVRLLQGTAPGKPGRAAATGQGRGSPVQRGAGVGDPGGDAGRGFGDRLKSRRGRHVGAPVRDCRFIAPKHTA
jgi:pimeloyl-ACP methyl ester carboxylesterase